MAKCKYPNEVCANMTVLNSVAYCDSTPCSLKDELPKQTNADRIRSMSDEELAEYLSSLIRNGHEYLTGEGDWRQWLQSEAE